MARKKSEPAELADESQPVDQLVDESLSVKEWLDRTVALVVDEIELARGLLPADWEILTVSHYKAGDDPETAADKTIVALRESREWLLELCAAHAAFQGFDPETRLSLAGSVPVPWVLDLKRAAVRDAIRGSCDHFFRYVSHQGCSLPLALPAAPYRDHFAERRDECVERFKSMSPIIK